MKKQSNICRIFAVLLCAVMLLSILPTSVFAAKENFYQPCEYIGIRGCAIPVAGETPDFDVEENWPSQYTIMSVNWYKGSVSASNAVGGTERFQGNTVYIVEFEVWAKSTYYFTTDSNGYTTVVADISPNYAEYGEFDAQVYNVYGKDNTKYLTVRYTFPKTASTATIINSINITGVDVPRAGDRTQYPVADLPTGVRYYTDSKGYYYDVAWYDGTKKLSNLEYFEEGKTYVCHLSLRAADGYEFATDPNVSTWPTVAVTINGKSATVVPDYTQGSGSEIIIAAAQFVCEPSRLITEVEILGVTEPKTDEKPSYSVSFGHSTYDNYPLSNYAYVDGAAWKDKDGTLLNATTDTFQPSTAYTIEIRLKAKEPYVFKYTLQDTPVVSATVNGNAAIVSAHSDGEDCLIVRYTFKRTAGRELSKVGVNDVEIPAVGAFPDYTAAVGDKSYALEGVKDDDTIKNNIAWFCDTTGEWMRVGKDKFIGGYTYSAFFYLRTVDPYVFKQTGEYDYTVSGKVNGKAAQLEECTEGDATIYYTFTVARNEVKKVVVDNIDIPKDGEIPDYTATLGDTTYVPQYTKDDNETKNSIMWYDETVGDYLKPDTDRFIGGHKYSVYVILKPIQNYTFKYVPESDSYTVEAKINGKSAQIEECVEDSLVIYYDFICEAHKCSPQKVDEVKATCKAKGKKAYYFCAECGQSFEDSKCTKEIADINTWGVLEMLAHTGGKATCTARAACKNCGEQYGELAAHKFGTAWDYKDATGHAHKCKECGITDTVVPHSGGTAKCGEPAKCAECKAEYGEVTQHQWSKTPEYTDKNGHAYKCTLCGAHDTVQAHTGGTADCQNKAKCAVCGTGYGKTGEHKWGSAWDYTDTKGHAHKCTLCGERDDIVKHTPGAAATDTTPQLCTVCAFVIEPETGHIHKMVKVDEVDATCTAAGKKQHYACSSCSLISSDSKGQKSITDPDSLIIPPTGHKESKWKTDADNHWTVCTVKGCGVIIPDIKDRHNFGDDGTCDTCGYKSKSGASTTEAPTTADTTAPEETTAAPDATESTPAETTAPVSEQSTNNDKVGGDEFTEQNGNGMWIMIIIAAAVAAVAMVVITVIVIKKNKRA